MSSIQLTDVNNFDTNNIVFSKPEVGNIAGQKISFKRIRIAARYPDGNVGDLIIATPLNLHCFGLQESLDLGSNAVNGYSLPICLWNKNGCTEDEKKFTDGFTSIVEHCKKYLLEHKEDIEKYDLDASDLKKFNPLFWKMEKGKIVEGRGPMLYAKANYNKKANKITTIFVNEDTNEEVEPFDLLNKVCTVTAALKIESIFIGNKISLQVKLFEVVFKIKDNTIRGLLRPNAIKRDMTVKNDSVVFPTDVMPGDDEDDDGSIVLENEDVQKMATTLPVNQIPVVQQPSTFSVALTDDEEDDEDEEIPPPAPVVAPQPTLDAKKKTPARASRAKK